MLEIKLHLHHLPQFEIHCIKVISNEMRRDIFLQIKKKKKIILHYFQVEEEKSSM